MPEPQSDFINIRHIGKKQALNVLKQFCARFNALSDTPSAQAAGTPECIEHIRESIRASVAAKPKQAQRASELIELIDILADKAFDRHVTRSNLLPKWVEILNANATGDRNQTLDTYANAQTLAAVALYQGITEGMKPEKNENSAKGAGRGRGGSRLPHTRSLLDD